MNKEKIKKQNGVFADHDTQRLNKNQRELKKNVLAAGIISPVTGKLIMIIAAPVPSTVIAIAKISVLNVVMDPE